MSLAQKVELQTEIGELLSEKEFNQERQIAVADRFKKTAIINAGLPAFIGDIQ